MFGENLSIPVFFHIPKNAGSFVLNRFFVYSLAFNKTKYNLNKRIDILKDGKVSYRLVVIDSHGECDNNKVFNQKTTRNYELSINDLSKELLDKFYVFSLIICGDGFNSYRSEIYPALPEHRDKHEFITFRESFSRAESFYFYLRSENSEHENLHGQFNHVTFDEYLSSYQVEDSWCIRFFTKLDNDKDISEKEFNYVCSLIDDMNVVYYKDIDSYLYKLFKNIYDIDALKHKKIFDVREVYDNKNKDKTKTDRLDVDALKIFNERTYWDQKLFNKYVKLAAEKNTNEKGKIVNCFYDGSENGIGDFLRGSIHLFNHCSSKNLDFDIDLSKHSISKFFSFQTESDKEYTVEDFYLKAVPTQNFLYQLKKQTDNILNTTKTGETKYIFSNYHPCLTDSKDIINYLNVMPPINNRCCAFLQDKLQFSDEINDSVYKKLKEEDLKTGKFNIIHFRLGDQNSFYDHGKNLEDLYKDCLVKCSLKSNEDDKPIIVLSDSNDLKKYFKENNKILPIHILHLESNHMQSKPSGFSGEIKTTDDGLFHAVFDMKLITLANSVESHSVYKHGSGFIYWIAKIFWVPVKLNLISPFKS